MFGGPGNDILIGGAGNDILVGGAGHDTLDGGPRTDILIDTGSVRVGKSPRTANKKSHGLIDWHVNYGDSLAAGHRVGGASYLSSPSWVRQFVVDLATYGLDPNGDISVTIPSSLEPELPTG